MKKGQMFLIGAIIMLIGLLMLKNLLGIYSTLEKTRYQETYILDGQLRNIMNEYKYLVGISSLQENVNDSGISYLWNFSHLIRDEIDSEILYIFIFVNGTNQRYSITLGNFLNDRINATINVTDSTPANVTLDNMDDRKNYTQEFSSSINGTINVTINYIKQNNEYKEFIPVTVSTKNLVEAFFDIKLKGDLVVSSKQTYNRTWS